MRGLIASKWEECDRGPALLVRWKYEQNDNREEPSPSRENGKNTTRREHTLPPCRVNRRPTGQGGASPSPSN